jgi:2,3,4,5-tetrahydropyridine-2-carboxylate N-succinyltransferase
LEIDDVKLPIEAHGIVQQDENGLLGVRYIKFQTSTEGANTFSLVDDGKIITHLIDDSPIEDIPTAWLKLHLLSLRFFKPNELNLENIFSVLPNIAWTSKGPMRAESLENIVADDNLKVHAIDKFPPMTDYIIPKGVRIADSSRVRLGAYLGEGTTIMHEGFVNYNAGTEGPNMIEGRISAGVFIGKDSDLGGGCSTMGTLSGGNTEVIKVGERCLLGANSGIGISLGNDCIVEAGLYLTAGTKVTMLEDDKVVKALELSGKDGILYFRDSLSGKVCARPNKGNFKLNEVLHDNN